MAGTWKTVRVFISSTFRDMHSERDWLIKRVFPELRERLEKYRVHLVDIDLRWGLTEQQAESGGALDLCLDQIDECRPFFLGLLGERYGWVPREFPERVTSKYGWIQHTTKKSITELEILHGVLNDPKMHDYSFFCFRDPAILRELPGEQVRNWGEFPTDDERRTQSRRDSRTHAIDRRRKLRALKQTIRNSGLPTPPIEYTCRYAGMKINWRLAKLELNDVDRQDLEEVARDGLVDPAEYSHLTPHLRQLVHQFGTVQLEGLEGFGERVQTWLWEAIRRRLNLPEQPPIATLAETDPLAEEQDYHERFMESRLRVYIGREQINAALLAFADGNHMVPCLVTGPSGSGKSAALSRFTRDYQHRNLQTFVIPHFVGASPRSTSLRDMLRRFCQVFKGHFGFAEDVPHEVAKLSVTFREFVLKVPADRRVLLVIDALNQLDETDRAQELYWLPRELPPQVKVVVSCITDFGKTEPALAAFRGRKHCPLQVVALNESEQRLIIRQVPSLSAKTLDDDQVRLLLSNPATANPLFLLVALEELRGFGSYERLNERIAAFPREGDTVTAIFTQVVERLTEEFYPTLVESVLTLLSAARRGLSERELQELVADHDGTEDLFPVLRQLRPYLLSRAGLIDFYHRSLFKAVRDHYFPSEAQQRQAHVRLAEYFNAQDDWLELVEDQRKRAKTFPLTPRLANIRKVDELPWHLLQAADWQKSEQLLTDLSFLEAKSEAGMVFDLAADFSAASGGISADRPAMRILRLLAEALRRDVHFIARHPTTLFQCLWNSCWWYDCPEAARHYVEGRTPGQQAKLDSHRLLEAWRVEKQRVVPGFLWLRSLRPPRVHLGTAQQAVFRGHSSCVTSVAASADGQRIVSGSWDHTVRLWDGTTGQELLCFQGHQREVYCVAFSPDGKRVASGSRDGWVRILDAATGDQLLCLDRCPGQVHCVAFSPDGQFIAAGAWADLRMWDSETGAEVMRYEDTWVNGVLSKASHSHYVTSVAFGQDGERIISGSGDSTIRVWDRATGTELLCLRGHTDKVTSVAVANDMRRLVSGSEDGTVRVWDLATGMDLLCLRNHTGAVTSVAIAPDGPIVSGSTDGTIRIWDEASGQQNLCLSASGNGVTSVAFLSNGRQIVSALGDGTVRFWGIVTDSPNLLLPEQDGSLHNAQFSPDGRRIVSGSTDGSVRIWNADTAVELLRLRTPLGVVDILGFSSDSQRVIISGKETVETVRVLDVSTGIELVRLDGHRFSITSAAFSADDRRIVSAAWDNTVRLWDASTGVELLCLDSYEDQSSECCVHTVAISRDGKRVMGLSDAWTLWVWDAATGDQLDVPDQQLAENELLSLRRPPSSLSCSRSNGDSWVVETTTNPKHLAWFPENLTSVSTHPSGRTWVGTMSNYVCLFTFESGG